MNISQFIEKRLPPTVAAAAMLALITSAQPVHSAEPAATTATAGAPTNKVARGKYLVTVAVCNDCHTPWKSGEKGPEPDMSRMLSGHPEHMVLPLAPRADEPWAVSVASTNTAWSGPWGVSFTANLTPDPETGLGRWTLRNFTDTIRSGRHMGRGRPILPPMPIPMYMHFTDEDLESIFIYLRSIPAVRNRVPEPLPPSGR